MDLDDLLSERAIGRALTRFARAMDERDWPALDEIVLEDVTGDVGTGPFATRGELVAVMRRFLDPCGPTQHLLGNVLIDVHGDRATSKAYVSDLHLGTGSRAALTFSTLGDYHDEWRRIDGAWRMSRRVKLNRATIGSMDVFTTDGGTATAEGTGNR